MRKRLIKLIFLALLPTFFTLSILGMGVTLWGYRLMQGLPDDSVIRDFTPNAVTTIYDKDGDALTYIYEYKNQIWAPLSHISEAAKKAVIAAEDPYFFKHGGIDYRQTWESLMDNLRVWKWVRGGSTITQQVAKNVYLSRERTLSRKLREYILAKRIEALLPKERILELYLNESGWGYGIYGVELASRFYLDKQAEELNIAEAAFITAMLRNPSYYNPYKTIERVTKRQRLVLKLMQRHDLITQEEFDAAVSYNIQLRRNKKEKRFMYIGLDRHSTAKNMLPCYVRLIEKYLHQTLGQYRLYDISREVKITIDDIVQEKVEDIIKEVEKENKKVYSDEDIRIGLVKENGNKVRAIGCTPVWEEASQRLKEHGKPFDAYTYEVASDKDIAWRDILLIGVAEIEL